MHYDPGNIGPGYRYSDMKFIYTFSSAHPRTIQKYCVQPVSSDKSCVIKTSTKFLTQSSIGTLKTGWQRQTKDFGHGQNTNRDQSNKYSCLIFDNRGIGESDKPLARYSTSEMAKDTLELIDEVGWTAERQLNIVGVSMGGMIAQEIVRLSKF